MAVGGLAIASMLMSAVPSLFQIGQGASQRRTASELAQKPRPKFEIPPAFNEALAIQRERTASEPMAGLGFAQTMAEGGTARSARGLQEMSQSPAELLAAASNIYGQQQEDLGQIAATNANFMQTNKMEQLSNLIGLLTQKADLQNKQFELNEFLPYMQAMNAAAAMEGAGTQNIGRGIGNLGTGLSSAFANLGLMDSLKTADIGEAVKVNDVFGDNIKRAEQRRASNSDRALNENLFEGNDLMEGAGSLMPSGSNIFGSFNAGGIGDGNNINLDLLSKLLGITTLGISR